MLGHELICVSFGETKFKVCLSQLDFLNGHFCHLMTFSTQQQKTVNNKYLCLSCRGSHVLLVCVQH